MFIRTWWICLEKVNKIVSSVLSAIFVLIIRGAILVYGNPASESETQVSGLKTHLYWRQFRYTQVSVGWQDIGSSMSVLGSLLCSQIFESGPTVIIGGEKLYMQGFVLDADRTLTICRSGMARDLDSKPQSASTLLHTHQKLIYAGYIPNRAVNITSHKYKSGIIPLVTDTFDTNLPGLVPIQE